MEGLTISEEMLYCPGPTYISWELSLFLDTKDPKGA